MSPSVRAAIVEELRRRAIPRADRAPQDAAVHVTVDGFVYRAMAGKPGEIATDVRWILANTICADAPDGAIMVHAGPTGKERTWTKKDGQWA